jgi:hypothetical protein
MVTFGWLLLLGTAGFSAAAIWANQDIFLNSAGVVDMLGSEAEVSVGQVFGAGAVAGALVIMGFWMVLSGHRRRTRRLAASRVVTPAPVVASVPVPRAATPAKPVIIEHKPVEVIDREAALKG